MSLYINILPASVDDLSVPIWGHPRDRELEDQLADRGDRGSTFEFYRSGPRCYVWPLTEAGPPADLDLTGWEQLTAAELPARVVAFAIRAAAVRHLVQLGFERLHGRPEAPTRLFRRAVNLAKKAYAPLKNEIGMFPLVTVQDIVLSDHEQCPDPWV